MGIAFSREAGGSLAVSPALVKLSKSYGSPWVGATHDPHRDSTFATQDPAGTALALGATQL